MTPTTDYCLNGITRQSVITIAKNLELTVEEKNLTFDDLLTADELFILEQPLDHPYKKC
jgi:branched-chain amino acid aminotransferase